VVSELVLTNRAQGKGGGVEGVVFWGWRNVRPDLWPGFFVFGAPYKDGHGAARTG
jgi:hypothetical protein